jgi:hypothetical protein
VSALSGANNFALSTSTIAGEFSVRKTSAGEAAFLHQLISQLAVAAVTQRHFNTGFFGKAIHPRLDQIFMLRVIDHNAFSAFGRQA